MREIFKKEWILIGCQSFIVDGWKKKIVLKVIPMIAFLISFLKSLSL